MTTTDKASCPPHYWCRATRTDGTSIRRCEDCGEEQER